MEYFNKYVSNTYCGSANQHIFKLDDGQVSIGRVFYKISVGGKYEYSFLFSNIIDSTYGDGSECHKNYVCDSWKIHSVKVARCTRGYKRAADEVGKIEGFKQVLFDGKAERIVRPGEFFCTDGIELEFDKGDYICLEFTFEGKEIPYHEETIASCYVKCDDGTWVESNKLPFVGMLGCNRIVKHKVAYLGDSITQGIGTPVDSYAHWNAVLSDLLGDEYAFWNLGIGFARADDAATDGAWLFKVKQNDVAVVCMGVNDLLQGFNAEQIKKSLTTIVKKLNSAGVRVVLQTVPPFDYNENVKKHWLEVNDYIKTVLSNEVEAVFDTVPFLGKEDQPQIAIYGGHPGMDGCEVWGKELYPLMKDVLSK